MEKSLNNFFRTSDEAIIYFEDYGEGKPIVLVPGFVCSTKFFEKNVEGLSKNNRVIVMDPRGHGNSSKTLEGNNIKRNAQDIKELLDFLDIKKATLAAWSMSGQIILKYHDLFGEYRIDSLALLDCPLGAVHPEEWNAHGMKGFNMDLFNKFVRMSYTNYEGFCGVFAKKIWEGNDDSAIEWATDEFVKTPPWCAFSIYNDLIFQNGYELLSDVKLPIAFFGADSHVTENGKILATKYYPEKAASSVYKESHTFESGGHVFFYVNATEFNEKMLGFVNKVQNI